jgi:predicted DNA-binding protein YlxM (UPF0122 family)
MIELFKVYPFNLALSILGDKKIAVGINAFELEKVVSEFSERTRMFLELRYKECLTYREIGEKLGYSMSRIQQVVKKAERMLRHPYRAKRYQTIIKCEHHKAIDELNTNINILTYERDSALHQLYELTGVKHQVLDLKWQEIHELDFSIRTYNCLKRAGINTTYDLTLRTELDIQKVRNLGAKCFNEVIEILKKNNITLKPEQEE